MGPFKANKEMILKVGKAWKGVSLSVVRVSSIAGMFDRPNENTDR
jgi:hypothetical protein